MSLPKDVKWLDVPPISPELHRIMELRGSLEDVQHAARKAIRQLNTGEATTGASALKQIAYMAEDALRHAENGGSGR